MTKTTLIVTLLFSYSLSFADTWAGQWSQADFNGSYPAYNYDDRSKPCLLSWFEKRTFVLEKSLDQRFDYVGIFSTNKAAVWRGISANRGCKFSVDGSLEYVPVPSYLRTWKLVAKKAGNGQLQVRAEFLERSGSIDASNPNDGRSWNMTLVRRGENLQEINPEEGQPFTFVPGAAVPLPENAKAFVRKLLGDISGGRCLGAVDSHLLDSSHIAKSRSNYCALMQQRRQLTGDLVQVNFSDHTSATDWLLMGPDGSGSVPFEQPFDIRPDLVVLLPYVANYENTKIPGDAMLVRENGQWKAVTID